MAEIINIKNEAGEVQYPVTKPECVIDENGKSVLNIIQENGTKLRQEIDELSERIDNLPKGNEFDKEGNYPLLHVGTADTAIDLAGRGESVPAEFTFRASGGKSIKDGRAYIKRIKGNSVVWNQWTNSSFNSATKTENGVTFTKNEDGSFSVVTDSAGATANTYIQIGGGISVINTHKYILYGAAQGGRYETYNAYATNGFASAIYDYGAGAFGTSIGGKTFVVIMVKSGQVISSPLKFSMKLIDLTQMFQAGNEPTTIEDFNTRVATLGIDMYAYNKGQVIHCNTESIKSVGDNAWDEEWELGIFDNTTGEKIPDSTSIRSKNPIRVLPNATYYLYARGIYARVHTYDADMNHISTFIVGDETYGYTFTTPTNCAYINFRTITAYGTTYNHDIMLTLVHSGWKQDTDAGYQPYWQDTLPLPIIRKYFPDGMKSAGSAHDEIRYNKSSGKWEAVQRIGSVDMGTLKWQIENTESSTDIRFVSRALDNIKTVPSGEQANILCAKYGSVRAFDTYKAIQGVAVKADSKISIYDASYTDAASLKASLQGVILYYELAGPIVTELDAEDQNFRDYYNVADFGTEMSQSSVPSAAFSADIIYQFNAVDMIREHELEITELQKVIATMQAQLASLTSNNA